MNNIKAMWIVVIAVFLDRISKYFCSIYFKLDQMVSYGKYLIINPTYNVSDMGGMSLFNATGNVEYDKWLVSAFFVIVTFAFLLVFYRLYKGTMLLIEQGYKGLVLTSFGVCLMSGGLIGNLLDRAFFKYVYDFILIYLGDEIIVCNVADLFIWLGFLVIIISLILETLRLAREKCIYM